RDYRKSCESDIAPRLARCGGLASCLTCGHGMAAWRHAVLGKKADFLKKPFTISRCYRAPAAACRKWRRPNAVEVAAVQVPDATGNISSDTSRRELPARPSTNRGESAETDVAVVAQELQIQL